MRRLWARFQLWSKGYCFKHKEFSCLICWRASLAELLKKAGEA